MRRTVRAVVLVASLGAVFAPARESRADVEETERRLKAVGVDDALRAQIHAAIARGAKYLISRQDRDGSMSDVIAWLPKSVAESGYTSLGCLALSHCGSKEATEAAQRGMRFLVRDGKRLRGSAMTFTYTAGISAMLLDALDEHPDVCREIVETLAGGIDPAHHWWGYGPARSDFGSDTDIPNLSTAQFAALGLWTGGRESGLVPRAVWRRHIGSLCHSQTEDGSWPYAPRRTGDRAKRGYPNGTFMGFANLLLAEAALAGELEDDPALAARTEIARALGLAALQRDGAQLIQSLPKGAMGTDFYGLYALEKACVFADREVVGGVPWYVDGARHLVAIQNGNGSWGSTRGIQGIGFMPPAPKGDIVSTSFALLFLLRISEAYHPITPRRVNAGGPTTPGGGPAAPPPAARGPAVPPPPRPVTLTQAREALSRVDGWLRARRADPANAIAALPDVAAALRNLVPDPLPPGLSVASQMDRERAFLASSKQWREEAGGVLIDAVGCENDEIAALAATALVRGPKTASTPLRSVMDRRIRPDHPDEAPRRLVDSAFRALAGIGNADALPWLAAKVTDRREMTDVRSARAALCALSEFEGGEAGPRIAAARTVVRRLEDLSRRASTAPPARQDALEARTLAIHWRTLGEPALRALAALCADPETGDPPRNPDGTPFSTLAQYAAWLDAVKSGR